MSELKSCENCRHDHDHISGYKHEWGGIGGDCNDCDGINLINWMPFKRVDSDICEDCFYDDDPCHYECYLCQDNRNFTPNPSKQEILEHEIRSHKIEILKLEKRMMRLKEAER